MQEEVWKDVKGYEGLFQVSSEGRVKSCEREIPYLVKGKYPSKRIISSTILKTYKNNKGYVVVDLHNQGNRDKRTIHRLVAETFIDNPDGKPQVGHLDCDRTNNKLENLYWCTQSENNLNPITHNKMKESAKKRDLTHLRTIQANEKRKKALTGHIVSEETKNKISAANSKKVYQYSLDGKLIAIYKSSVDASQKTTFPQSEINKHINGKWFRKSTNKWYFSHTYKGYNWYGKPI